MFVPRTVIVCVIFCTISAHQHVSFRNVTFSGFSTFTHKFDKFITSSNDLKAEIPKEVFDTISMKNQRIPILYRDCIKDISALDELILEGNNIEEIQPGAFKNLENLRKLNLYNNRLTIVKAGVFNDLPVSDLELSKNSIKTIEETAFNDMSHLMNIRLTDNKIQHWNPNWFKNAPILTRVTFENNEIEELPSEAFKNLWGHKKVGGIRLKLSLVFSHNKIKKLYPDTFSGLQNLNNLWLDNNFLKELPPTLLDGLTIRKLMVSHNNLTCIENKDELLKADLNDIDGNPMQCDCLEQIKKWSKEKNKHVTYFYSDMRCFTEELHHRVNHLKTSVEDMKTELVDANQLLS